jgi:hypothetical protein
MPFHGWTDAVLDFYEALEVDNSPFSTGQECGVA